MLCYLMLLNRAPTAPELAQGQSQGLLDLLADVVREGEFAQRFFSAYWGLDEGNRHQRATHAFYAYVEALGDTRLKALETALRALPRIPDQGHDYVAYHHLHCHARPGAMGSAPGPAWAASLSSQTSGGFKLAAVGAARRRKPGFLQLGTDIRQGAEG
jgi:hypothetical protein